MTNKFYLWQKFLSRFGLWKSESKIFSSLRKIKFWIRVFLVDFVLKLKGIKIIEAKTEEEKEMIYKLRYEIYKDCGYINPEDFPDKELKDEDDKHSINYLALENNKPVGTVRLILGNKKEDFPTFRMWNIDFNKFSVPFSKIGEISKLCIVNSSKNKKFWIWLGMMKKIYKKNKITNLNYWIFFSSFQLRLEINKKFNTPIHSIPYLKEIEKNLREREIMKGYFKILNPLPFFLKIEEIGLF
ncbi:MAG: GNAT family N-acyltransferase [Patescibacteria group bacterium]|nr:GNAT family N-acyltransferase [Patescibacteria group bacterium]